MKSSFSANNDTLRRRSSRRFKMVSAGTGQKLRLFFGAPPATEPRGNPLHGFGVITRPGAHKREVTRWRGTARASPLRLKWKVEMRVYQPILPPAHLLQLRGPPLKTCNVRVIARQKVCAIFLSTGANGGVNEPSAALQIGRQNDDRPKCRETGPQLWSGIGIGRKERTSQ